VSEHAVLPRPGDSIGGKYRVERLLGAGGMGAVFEATHRVTGRHFAIKRLLPDLASSADVVARFFREAQVAGRFQHANVVEVYDIGQDGGSFFIVMELLVGESLADRLTRAQRLTVPQACEVLLPCMGGVSVAHAAGVIHRDLKPANIFLCRSRPGAPEHPKVLDFGISKLSSLDGVPMVTLTMPGAVMGTPLYMAPEQVRGARVDHRTDVYAFGVMLYECLSGRRPFAGAGFADLVLALLHEVPTPLAALVPGLPDGLAQVVARAMARDPDARFDSVDQLQAALDVYRAAAHAPVALHTPRSLAPSPSSSPSQETSGSLRAVERERARASPAPHRRSATLLVFVVAAACLAALVLLLRARDPQASPGLTPPSTAATRPPAPEPPAGVLRPAPESPAPARELPAAGPATTASTPEPPLGRTTRAASVLRARATGSRRNAQPPTAASDPAPRVRPKLRREDARPSASEGLLRDDQLIDPFGRD